MPARNAFLAAPPNQVDHALKPLGANLRTARLRRNLSIEDVASTGRMISAGDTFWETTGVWS
jgi:hypothetical protein